MSQASRAAELTLAPPRFEVRLQAPDLARWRDGNSGVPGFHTRAGSAPGPHVVVVALTHGNEVAGAIAVRELLEKGARPSHGVLTMGFANLDAFDRFDPAQPTASRFLDEDLNRLWDASLLDGPRQSAELNRAREMRPLIDRADVLLDLHSMLWESEPLVLCGQTAKGFALARGIGVPALVVADGGHVSGRRLIDYAAFADPLAGACAVLVEAGQHWESPTVQTALESVAGLLRHLGIMDEHPALPPRQPRVAQRFARVTRTVTAATSGFVFLQPYCGGEVVPEAGTLIAVDGDLEIRTPYRSLPARHAQPAAEPGAHGGTAGAVRVSSRA